MTMTKGEEEANETAVEASAGEEEKVDSRDKVRARANVSDLMSAQELNERQQAIGGQRKRGGPPLDEKPDETAAAPDVPETNPDEAEEEEL